VPRRGKSRIWKDREGGEMPRAAVAAETTSSVERSDARPPPIHGFMMLDLYVRSPPPTKKKSAHDVVVIMMSATQGFGGMY